MIISKSIRSLAFSALLSLLWLLPTSQKKSLAKEKLSTRRASKQTGQSFTAVSSPRLVIPMLKLSAYQAAMICMGRNVDEYEIVERGTEVQDGDHFFRNTIFKNFVGEMFVLEEIRDDDGQLVRPWEAENDCAAVKQVVYHEDDKDQIKYVELEDEEPLQ